MPGVESHAEATRLDASTRESPAARNRPLAEPPKRPRRRATDVMMRTLRGEGLHHKDHWPSPSPKATHLGEVSLRAASR